MTKEESMLNVNPTWRYFCGGEGLRQMEEFWSAMRGPLEKLLGKEIYGMFDEDEGDISQYQQPKSSYEK